MVLNLSTGDVGKGERSGDWGVLERGILFESDAHLLESDAHLSNAPVLMSKTFILWEDKVKSMSPLTQALQDIDYWIQNSNSWHAKWIRSGKVRPGLEWEVIQLYSEEYDFCFSKEVYELYEWHDGDIRIGDYANLVMFATLDQAVRNIVAGHIPYRPYMPLFIGDEAYWVIPEASKGQRTSPIFFLDSFISSGRARPDDDFDPRVYAPSITCLMQAIAECAKTYDEISAEHMYSSGRISWSDIYPERPKSWRSILSPVYDKYGVVGDSSGIWR